MFKRLAREILYLSMTISGVGLVLITLTDQVLVWAIWITAISLITHMIGVGIDYLHEKKEDKK